MVGQATPGLDLSSELLPTLSQVGSGVGDGAEVVSGPLRGFERDGRAPVMNGCGDGFCHLCERLPPRRGHGVVSRSSAGDCPSRGILRPLVDGGGGVEGAHPILDPQTALGFGRVLPAESCFLEGGLVDAHLGFGLFGCEVSDGFSLDVLDGPGLALKEGSGAGLGAEFGAESQLGGLFGLEAAQALVQELDATIESVG